jgi:hypothetical protein
MSGPFDFLNLTFLFRLLPMARTRRVIHPFLFSVNVWRNEPFLFHDHEYVFLFRPPVELVFDCVNLVRTGDFVVICRVVLLIRLVVRLYAMIFGQKKNFGTTQWMHPSFASKRLL